ncbi:MAG: ATP-binding cassette domain-containing protein [Flavobacterium sp.]|nr:ATP-binding cassette domain-containing protein [Flavobacterium sp.]
MEESPFIRFINLLKVDRKDVTQIIFYAIFAGIISLSLPLGIQAIINLIQSGRVSASWVLLVLIVVIGVALGGILSIMQLRITENLQQKIFVRSSFDFSYRLPKIKFEELYNKYTPELANRFFDTMVIQKGASKLLLDFSSSLLQIIFGIILLALYHPFFILFGVFLLVLLYVIFKFSYNSGLSTSLNESKYKYKVVAWLQEIARNSSSFKRPENFDFALSRNNDLVEQYIGYREKHFNVIKRQFMQLIGFKILITASLLFIGGYLVLNQQMNIGQFVAAEIIIILVINSVEKVILGLETFYDVLTSVEKIAQVFDLEIEKYNAKTADYCFTKLCLETDNLSLKFPDNKKNVLSRITLKIDPEERVFLDGENGSGKSSLLRVLSGLIEPTSGAYFINDDTYLKIDKNQLRSHISVVMQEDTPFEGSILENITFMNPLVSNEQVKWAIDAVGLGDFIKSMPEGLDTKIVPEGKQLSSSNAQKILIARSIVTQPKVLLLEDPLNKMDTKIANEIIDFLVDPKHKWTLIVSSKNEYWKQKCSRIIELSAGKLIADSKTQNHA